MAQDPTVNGDISPPGEGERQAGLEQILRAVANGIMVQNRAGRLVYANEAAARASGYASAAEFLAADPLETLSKFEIRDRAGEPYPLDRLPGRRVMEGEASARDLLQYRYVGTEQEYWADVQASPIRDSEGNTHLVVNIFNDLTEQMKIENALRESETRYRHLVDTSPDAIFLTDADGTIVMANRAAAAIAGVADPADLTGRRGVDLVVPEQRHLASESIERILGGSALENAAFTILSADGRHVPVEVNATRISNGDSVPRSIVTIMRQVGERQQLQDALREQAETAQQERVAAELSREHYRLLNEAIPQIIWTADADGIVDYWNRQWFDYTGTTSGNATGTSAGSIVHDDELEMTRQSWAGAQTSGEPFSIEYRLRRHDGIYRWHLGRALPLKDADGRILRWFGTCTDIDDQKRAEQTLRFLEEAGNMLASLIDSEQNIDQVAALVTPQFADWCSIDLLDDDLTTVRRVAISHIDPEMVSVAYELKRLYPPDMRGGGDTLSRVLISGIAVVAPEITDEILVRSSRGPEHLALGRQLGLRSLIIVPLIVRERTIGAMTFVTSTSGRRYSDSDLSLARELAGKIAVALDNARLYRAAQQEIEERTQAEIALKQAMERAEAANESKSRFLAVLSHELRTPLTPVMTALETLSLEKLPEWVTQMMEIVRRNVELEARLIDDLLDLTRISRGKVQLQMEPVDVHALLRNVVEICETNIAARAIDLQIDLASKGYHVVADPARLQQILCNLLNNAIKFTPEGGTVSIRTSISDNRLQVEVADTGIGIEPALLPIIFDAFEQGDESITRRYGGLGLGLAISKTLVEMHGGTLEASSEGSDKGSTFTMSMPSASAPTSTQQPSPSPAGTDGTQQEIRILLVDDHVDTSKVMKMLLERRGYQVRTADSVGTALEQVRGNDFDLMISDIGLPDGSGHDLMRTIRAEGRDLKAVALSGFGMEEDVRRSMDAGFQEHLTKPVGVQKLQEVINRLLE